MNDFQNNMKPLQTATLKIEYPRRRQIFDESVSIIQKTNTPDVLFRRYDEVSSFVQWAFQLKKEGCAITIEESEEQMNAKLPAFYNFHCARIANYVAVHSPKTNRFQILRELQGTLKDATNKEEAFIEIAQLINKTILG